MNRPALLRAVLFCAALLAGAAPIAHAQQSLGGRSLLAVPVVPGGGSGTSTVVTSAGPVQVGGTATRPVISLNFAGGVTAPSTLPKVAATGNYGDLGSLPTLLTTGTAAGTARDAAAAIAAEGAGLQKSNNLADLPAPATARGNLGLGSLATAAYPASSSLLGSSGSAFVPVTLGSNLSMPGGVLSLNGVATVDTSGSISSQSRHATTGLVSRTLAAVASDVYNVMDYGASATGSVVAIGTRYGANLAATAAFVNPLSGTTLFSWLLNPAYGYQFPLTSSSAGVADGSNLDLFFTDTPVTSGTAAVTAVWDDPQFASYHPMVGELVSDISTGTGHPCITANSPVTAIQTFPWRMIDLVPGAVDWTGSTAYTTASPLIESGGGIWQVTTGGTSAASVPVTAPGGAVVQNTNGPSYAGYFGSNSSNSIGYVYTDAGGVKYTLEAKIEYQQLYTGRLTVSGNSGASCPANTVFQVTISPAQLQGISTDTIADQTAIALANTNVRGGVIYHPTGTYAWNWPVINQTASGIYTPDSPYQITWKGDDADRFRVIVTSDYGPGFCGLAESNRYNGTSYSTYEGFTMVNLVGTNGVAEIMGTSPIPTRGLCVGQGEADNVMVNHFLIKGFYSAVGFVRDHQHFANYDVSTNGYGFEAMPYSASYGNQEWQDGGSADYIGNYGISSTAQMNAGKCSNVHQGSAPFIFHSMPVTPNVTLTYSGTVSQMQMDSCVKESVGESIFEGSGSYAQFSSNIDVAGGGAAVGSSLFQRPNGAGGTVSSPALYNLPNGDFSSNLFNDDIMGAFSPIAAGYSAVSTALIISRTCAGNHFDNDPTIITGVQNNAPSPSLSVFKCQFPTTANPNTAKTTAGDYEFHPVVSSTAGRGVPIGGGQYGSAFSLAGIPVQWAGNGPNLIVPNGDGPTIFGFTAVPCPEANTTQLCPIQTSGIIQTPSGGATTIQAGQPVGVSVMGSSSGIAQLVGLLDSDRSIGTALGNCTVSCQVALGERGGGESVLLAQTAGSSSAPYAVTSRITQFTGPGGYIYLPVAGKLGDAVTIFNDGTSQDTIEVPGASFLVNGQPVTISAGASAEYHRIGESTWH